MRKISKDTPPQQAYSLGFEDGIKFINKTINKIFKDYNLKTVYKSKEEIDVEKEKKDIEKFVLRVLEE